MRKRPFEQLYEQSTGYHGHERGPPMSAFGQGESRPGGMNPQLAAEIVIAKFAKLWGSGQMSRDKTISVL
jgi:hypothetical protein